MVAGTAPPEAPAAVRRVCLVILLCSCGVLGWIGWQQISAESPDFEYFYKAGAWLLTHGGLDRGYDVLPAGQLQPRGTIEWYLPVVSRLFTLLGWLPFPVAGAIWLTLNLVLLLATLRLLGRRVCGLPPNDWPVTLLLPFLLLIVYWRWEFYLNQINVLTLALVVAGFVQWRQGRPILAGILTGLAALLKLTPALLIGWYALKRDYRAAGSGLLVILAFGPLADGLVFGPRGAVEAYRAWAHTAVVHGSHRQLILDGREMDWRNQGLGAVLARWLTPTSYALRFDNDPRLTLTEPPATMNIVQWPRPVVAALATGIVGLALVGLAWLARRPAYELSEWQVRIEWALVLLVMLALMPVLRRYHFIALLPALAVLAGGIHHVGPRHGWTWLCAGCLVLASAAQLTMLDRSWEATGLLWLSIVLLGLPLAVLYPMLSKTSGLFARVACPAPISAGDAGAPPSDAHEQPHVSHA